MSVPVTLYKPDKRDNKIKVEIVFGKGTEHEHTLTHYITDGEYNKIAPSIAHVKREELPEPGDAGDGKKKGRNRKPQRIEVIKVSE